MIAEPDFLCSIEMNTVNPFYAIQSKRARDLQPLRSANLAVGVLTLILLVAVPVSGAPAFKVGSNSSYTLSFSITFSPPFCENKSLFRPSDDRLLSHDRHCTSNLQHQRNPRLDCDEPHKHHGHPERRPRGYNLILGQSSRY